VNSQVTSQCCKASRHICSDDEFIEVTNRERVTFTTANGEADSPHRGTVSASVETESGEARNVTLRDVHYLRRSQHNILSVGQLMKSGIKIDFTKCCLVLPGGPEGSNHPRLTIPLIQRNGLYFVRLQVGRN
jgi:hypothetical protein